MLNQWIPSSIKSEIDEIGVTTDKKSVTITTQAKGPVGANNAPI
jgi:hypothetical protein